MTGLTLTYRGAPGAALDLGGLLPERLAGLSAAEVARLDIPGDGGAMPLGELFEVAADDAADGLRIRSGAAELHRVGAGMASGAVTVEGNAGPYAGAGMRGGLLRITGDAGAHLGSALPGHPGGMGGGLILVGGDAGDRVAERMRRGVIVVDGRVGAFAAAFLVAGTMAAGGGCGPQAGFGMRRGTLLLGRPPERAPEGFTEGGTRDWLFLHLLRRSLEGSGCWFERTDTVRARRYLGDLAEGGRGEILALV